MWNITSTIKSTVPVWSRQPVAPGGKTEVKVEVTPDTPGSFRKTGSVYGNVENAPKRKEVGGKDK
jgi:hypothetical protein